MSTEEAFVYDDGERVIDFGVSKSDLDSAIDSGEPFRTSGCQGYDGEVACNRPFANSRPGPLLRNYPFPPNKKDVSRIRKQLLCGALPYAYP
jgi:biotin synthase